MKKALILLILLLVAIPVVIYALFPGVALALAIWWERGAAGLTQKSAQAAGHEIVYLEGGEGPTLLLVHGFAADKDNWTRFARLLTSSYRVVALDLPGFGESSILPEQSYDVASQAARLEAFVKELGLERFHIAGNSMGGNIAGIYAADYPDRVLSLGLLATGGIAAPRPSEIHQRMHETGGKPLIAHSVEEFHRMLEIVFVEVPFIPGPILEHLAGQAVAHQRRTRRSGRTSRLIRCLWSLAWTRSRPGPWSCGGMAIGSWMSRPSRSWSMV